MSDRLWRRQRNLTITEWLRIGKSAVMKVVNSDGSESEIDLTELGVLDGLTATTAELNRSSDVSARLVTIVATGSITEAANENKINMLADVGGDTLVTLTLPAATGSGGIFHFKVGVVNTSNYVIQVDSASATIDGLIIGAADGGDTVNGWETAADSDTITLDGTTTGGVSIGDWVELVDIGTDQWSVAGQITQSGVEATPFSAAVS